MVTALTEFSSNVATASIFIPMVSSIVSLITAKGISTSQWSTSTLHPSSTSRLGNFPFSVRKSFLPPGGPEAEKCRLSTLSFARIKGNKAVKSVLVNFGSRTVPYPVPYSVPFFYGRENGTAGSGTDPYSVPYWYGTENSEGGYPYPPGDENFLVQVADARSSTHFPGDTSQDQSASVHSSGDSFFLVCLYVPGRHSAERDCFRREDPEGRGYGKP